MAAWIGFVDDTGHFALDDRDGFKSWITKFAGHEVVLLVKKRPKLQGTQSLRYLRGVVIPDITLACGYNPDDPDECQEVYDGVMWKLFRLPDGAFGQPRRESCSKATMSQERISEVIDKIIIWGETTIVGCRVRRPDEVDIENIAEKCHDAD